MLFTDDRCNSLLDRRRHILTNYLQLVGHTAKTYMGVLDATTSWWYSLRYLRLAVHDRDSALYLVAGSKDSWLVDRLLVPRWWCGIHALSNLWVGVVGGGESVGVVSVLLQYILG